MNSEKIKNWIKVHPDYPTVEDFTKSVLGIERSNFYTKLKNERFSIKEMETILGALGKSFHELYDEETNAQPQKTDIEEEYLILLKKYTALLEKDYSILFRAINNSQNLGKPTATNGKDLEAMPMEA